MIWRTPKYTGPERRKTPRKRRRPFRTLLLLLWLAVGGYGAGVLWLLTQETRLVFQAVKTMGDSRPPFAYEQIDLPRSDGARQFAWVMTLAAPDAPWVVYLHGNPSTIASSVNISHYAVLRGLGRTSSPPSTEGSPGSTAPRRRAVLPKMPPPRIATCALSARSRQRASCCTDGRWGRRWRSTWHRTSRRPR